MFVTLQLPALPEEHPLAAITKKIIIIIIKITIIKSNNNNYNNKDKQAVHSFKPRKTITKLSMPIRTVSLFSCHLAQVVSRRISAAAVIETHGIHIVNVQVAVGVVIAIRLVVFGHQATNHE